MPKKDKKGKKGKKKGSNAPTKDAAAVQVNSSPSTSGRGLAFKSTMTGSALNAQYPQLLQMRCLLHVPDDGTIHTYICSHSALPPMVIRQTCSLTGEPMSGEYSGNARFPVLKVRVCFRSPPVAEPPRFKGADPPEVQDMPMFPWRLYVLGAVVLKRASARFAFFIDLKNMYLW